MFILMRHELFVDKPNVTRMLHRIGHFLKCQIDGISYLQNDDRVYKTVI